jgi:hypothetical protein
MSEEAGLRPEKIDPLSIYGEEFYDLYFPVPAILILIGEFELENREENTAEWDKLENSD